MKKSVLSAVAALIAATALAGCSPAPGPSTAPTPSSSAKFKACMVSDSGGFDDKSFNQTSHAGLLKAKAELGLETAEIESSKVADFPGNIQKMIDQKCNMVITVGFLLEKATIAAAQQNPDVKFVIVDSKSEGTLKNHKGLVFNTAESSFLGGYLAASLSQTGKVGTYGGAKIPTVTIFMDGFAQGVAHYNQAKGKNVQVIGWDAAKQDGQFVPGGFEDQNGALSTARTLASQGADILFPVAGPAGLGALQAASEFKGKVNVLWVDADGYEKVEAKYKPLLISSVVKAMDVGVFDTIKAASEGKFDSASYVGTLENNGTGLAPFHDFDSKVSAEIKADLAALKADIVSGKIKITSVNQPK